ncbi:MAG: hypothetical protein ABI743_07685, partial [bacterium]
ELSGMDVPGLIRVTDPESELGAIGPVHAGLDPTTLAAVFGGAIKPITYQGFVIHVDGSGSSPNPPALAPLWLGIPASSGKRMAVEYVANGPVPYWGGVLHSSSALRFVYSSNTTPQVAQDWSNYDLLEGVSNVGAPDLAIWGSHLVIGYVDHTTTTLVLLVSDDLAPVARTDWQRHDLLYSFGAGDDLLALTKVGTTRLAMLFIRNGSSEVAETIAAAPWAESDWTTLQLASVLPSKYDPLYPIAYALTTSGLSATYCTPAMPGMPRMPMVGISADPTPASPSDWYQGVLTWGAPITAPFAQPVGVHNGSTLIALPAGSNIASLSVARTATPVYSNYTDGGDSVAGQLNPRAVATSNGEVMVIEQASGGSQLELWALTAAYPTRRAYITESSSASPMALAASPGGDLCLFFSNGFAQGFAAVLPHS